MTNRTTEIAVMLGEGHSLASIGRELGLSRQRIAQIVAADRKLSAQWQALRDKLKAERAAKVKQWKAVPLAQRGLFRCCDCKGIFDVEAACSAPGKPITRRCKECNRARSRANYRRQS